MKTIDKYYLRIWIRSFVKVLITLPLLFILVDFFVTRQDCVRKYDIPLVTVFQYYFFYLPRILFQYHFLAVSVMLTCLLVMGRSAQEREVLALLSAGIPYKRIVLVVLVVVLLLGVLGFFIEDSVGVWCAQQLESLERQYFSYRRGILRSGVSWANLTGGWTCHVIRFNKDALTGRDVLMHRMDAEKIEEIRARYIWWDHQTRRWLIEDGRYFTLFPRREMEQQVMRITQMPAPFTEPPEVLFALELPPEQKTWRQFYRDILRARSMGMVTNRYEVDWYLRFTRPMTVWILGCLALALSYIAQRGGFIFSFGITLVVSVTYLVCHAIFTGLGYLGLLSPWISAFLSCVIFALVTLMSWKRVWG